MSISILSIFRTSLLIFFLPEMRVEKQNSPSVSVGTLIPSFLSTTNFKPQLGRAAMFCSIRSTLWACVAQVLRSVDRFGECSSSGIEQEWRVEWTQTSQNTKFTRGHTEKRLRLRMIRLCYKRDRSCPLVHWFLLTKSVWIWQKEYQKFRVAVSYFLFSDKFDLV